MDRAVKNSVDEYWAGRFGLGVAALGQAEVWIVPARTGEDGVALFRIGPSCVVVVVESAIEATRARLRGLPPDTAFSREVAARLIGDAGLAHGPSWHGYASKSSFHGHPDEHVERLEVSDPRFTALRNESGLADWAEGGFPLNPSATNPTDVFYGYVAQGQIVAAGNMTEWRGLPSDVGLVTRPDQRRKGLATAVAATLTAEWLPTVGIVRYRALTSNERSLAIAAQLGFEGYGFNIFARSSAPVVGRG
jgi:GNAT superfamily N-acetyltransferase